MTAQAEDSVLTWVSVRNLAYAVSEFEVSITDQARDLLTHLARLMGSETAMRDLSRLPEQGIVPQEPPAAHALSC